MPEPRTPGAVWLAWGTAYWLQRGQSVLARIEFEVESVRTTTQRMPPMLAHRVCSDFASVQAWLARGGR